MPESGSESSHSERWQAWLRRQWSGEHACSGGSRQAQTRIELSGALRQTNRLADRDVPLTLGNLRRNLERVGQLSGTLDRETASTGAEARQATVQAQDLMRTSGPMLIQTLQELQTLSATTNGLLNLLVGSRRLEPTSPGQPPAGAPPPSPAPLSQP